MWSSDGELFYSLQWSEGKPALSMTRAHKSRIESRFWDEIRNRGGEIAIHGKYDSTWVHLKDWKRVGPERKTLYLLHAEGWRSYGRRHPARVAHLSYLCGIDDNGPWAVRVPGTLTRVSEAYNWLTPSVVAYARKQRRRVLRQGDVYAVEVPVDRAALTAERLEGHTWCPTSRLLLHDGGTHLPLKVGFPCHFTQQRAYRMGRSNQTGFGD